MLIITYYFPPAGGPGVQRWLKFVKYLPEFGIEPIVFIPQNPSYPIIDEKLVSEIPSNLKIIRHPIWEPFNIAKKFSKKSTNLSAGIIPTEKKQSFFEKFLLLIRGNFFIPDARIFWVKPSVEFLERYLVENNIETIVTSGPPHSLHLIGMKLSSKLDVKWIADFRDPWTTIGYHKKLKLNAFAKSRHKRLEHKVLNAADEIIVTSKTTKQEFSEITNRPIHVITNGYDDLNVESISLDEKFSIAHIGSILSERNPENLWIALAELSNEIGGFKDNLELKFIGITSSEIIQKLENLRLKNIITNLGYVSHDQALLQQRRAQILLLIEIDSPETRSIIPGKLFEYIAAQRPIVAIGPKDSDIEEILKESNAGCFFDYSQKNEIKSMVKSLYENYKTGSLISESSNIEKYSRRNLTEQLSKILLK